MEEVKKSGFSTAALVLGIIGVCLSFIPIVNNAAFVLGVLSVIFAIVAFAKKAPAAKSVVAIVLGVCAVVITLVMQKAVLDSVDDAFGDISSSLDEMTGGSTEELLQNSVNVEIGNFTVEESDFLDDTKLEITVKNIGEEKASFSVSIEALDQDGARIDTDTVYIDGLGAGQSVKEKLFTLVDSEKTEALKTARFKVYEVSKY